MVVRLDNKELDRVFSEKTSTFLEDTDEELKNNSEGKRTDGVKYKKEN